MPFKERLSFLNVIVKKMCRIAKAQGHSECYNFITGLPHGSAFPLYIITKG